MVSDDQEYSKVSPPHGTPGAPVSCRTILLMDDEESILEAFGRLLTLKGYTVIPARNGNEALALYRSAMDEGIHIDVVILDLIIPGGMGGIETIGQLKTIDPGVRALVSSGLSHEIMAEHTRYGFAAAIPKPYQWTDLISAINRVLMQD